MSYFERRPYKTKVDRSKPAKPPAFLKHNISPKKHPSLKFEVTPEYRAQVCAQAYIGKKGYTIPKACLHPDDLKFLYQDLYMIPVKHGPAFGPVLKPGDDDPTAFPVYRENTKKIYLPRFYGLERYGAPTHGTKGAEGEPEAASKIVTISCVFDKPLRDYQEAVVEAYMKSVRKEGRVGSHPQAAGGILQLYAGAGKTVLSIKIISLLAKKTLIIVHKEFLLNQWVERIREFMPEANIGRIQGPLFDVHGKDIVIGMLQTLYDRDFPEDAFDEFGLTIVDEVHRIGSCQFSKALVRVQTPYMLGVTATLERKDGLTRVIHHFIGPLLFSQANRTSGADDSVLVRGMEFVSNDAEFNDVVTDFRGNPQFSTMISKLCNHGPRTQFLVKILADLIAENPEAQILVLGHNRSLLVDLHEAIEVQEIATCGYYLGGMKPAALEKTTERQIILASYAMAAEGFDHKNLSILVMITPKTDIIQSVGRIFRQKHARPLIVDIIDTHDIFQNQWKKRRAYYKKCGYRIHMTSSPQYRGFDPHAPNPTPWKVWFEPKKATTTGVQNEDTDGDDDDESAAAIKGQCLISFVDDGTDS
jgi:superfamily II DNA or RNA helicase